MSPDDPQYLPADAAAPLPESNLQHSPTRPYTGEGRDEDHWPPLTTAGSRSLFHFLEVPYPLRPRFPASVGWAVAYVAAGFMVVLFFWIFAQIIPGLIALVGALIWELVRTGEMPLTSPDALTQLTTGPMLVAGHIAAISLGLILLRLLLGPDWTRRLAFRLPSAWHALLVLLLVPAVVVLATGVYGLAKQIGIPSLGELFGMKKDMGMEKIMELFGTWPLWVAVLIVGVGPALGEELWCRGLIQLGLFGRNGVVARILVSSLYFGVLHGDPQQGTMAAVMGLVLAYVLLTTRCFWMPMLIHFLNNSIDMAAGHFEISKAIDREPNLISPVLYLGAFILFKAIAISLYRTRARLVNISGSEPPQWEPVYSGMEHPPANCGVVVRRPCPTWIDFALVAYGVGTFIAAVVWVVTST